MKYAIKIRSIIWRKISMFNLSKKKINKIYITFLFKSMKNDTRIQSVVSNTQPKEPGFQGGLALCGRLGQALRSGAYLRNLPLAASSGCNAT